MIILELLWSFIQIGLFSFGGGYAALPLIQEQVVSLHGWLTMSEFADVVTISQMTPGPIAINAASFIGTRMAGLPGAVAATLGCVFPSIVIVLTLAWVYFRYRNLSLIKGMLEGLRPAVVALIASAGLSILLLALFGSDSLPTSMRGVSWMAVALFAIGFIVIRRFKVSQILVIIGSGGIGLALHLLGIPIN
jgi:chromate transporter